jgi:FAD-dependent urate hydroxylase
MAAHSARSNVCDTIVIGAGPYGLAVAAHLKERGVDTRVFGEPMAFWRRNMPKGMFLRSPWRATHISDPHGALTLDAYLSAKGVARTEPLPLETFIGYGEWFQAHAVPDLDGRTVEMIERTSNGFRAITADDEAVTAARIVVATGLAHQAFRPQLFADVPAALVSHSSDHNNFEPFRGKRVAVIGRGQSACESAVLLREAGAEVDILCRRPIHWLAFATGVRSGGSPWYAGATARLSAILATPSGVGPFPLNWMVEIPGVVHRLPDDIRTAFNAASLKAGAAGWLRPRFDGVRVIAGSQLSSAAEKAGRIELTIERRPSVYDHVLLGTGYKIEIAKAGIFAPSLLGAISCRDGAPVLSRGFESSVPALHFVGASAVASFGPLMRFIAGTRFAAREVARAIAAPRMRAPAGQARQLAPISR